MHIFHRVEERQAGRQQPRAKEDRLAVGQSVAVIAGLSALSWAVLIAVVVALRAAL